MNLSGTINAFRLFYAPKLARPHVILDTFNDLNFPLSKCITTNIRQNYRVDIPPPDIRAVVIDKDNCFAEPHSLKIWPEYKVYSVIFA
jgi:phosphatidylglycerophosphatase GEP4